MAKKTTKKAEKCTSKCMINKCDSGGGIYCLGFIGAAIFYVSQATTFWGGVVGFLKALVWPAFLVHGLLKFLGM